MRLGKEVGLHLNQAFNGMNNSIYKELKLHFRPLKMLLGMAGIVEKLAATHF